MTREQLINKVTAPFRFMGELLDEMDRIESNRREREVQQFHSTYGTTRAVEPGDGFPIVYIGKIKEIKFNPPEDK